MTSGLKLAVGALGGAAAGLGVLWWLTDHRRGTAWAVSVVRRKFPDIGHVSAGDAHAWLTDEERVPPRIIDARSDDEFAMSHLPEALHLNAETVTDEELRQLDPQRVYLVYCSAGYRSSRLVRRMKALGLERANNLEGGIFAWANAGLPVERDGRIVREVHPFHRLFARLLKPEVRP
jgi:rhodanese-related sulfurtransferase